MKTIIKIIAAMLVFMAGPVLAESGAYQIELMVFAQSMPTTEVFDQVASRIKWPSDLTELSAYKQADATTLNESYAALAKDPAYRPLLHVAWIQPVAEGAVAAPVHIQGADGKLNGYVQLQVEQGLRMAIDLELASNQGEGAEKALIYRLNEKYAIKSNVIYYLDHPKFGAVARISPL